MKYLHYFESISDFEDKSENYAVSDPWVSVTEGFEGVTYSPALDTGGYECVDLGLPSGIFWASRNIGASNPEDYGYYFAWGEVNPKETYNWDTYAWGTSASSFSRYGQANQAVSLYASDDAAIVRMGSFWRMPTSSEAQEILNNTAVTIETLNGVNGARFTGQNGNSIFIPAAGHKYNTDTEELGNYCDVWTSTRVSNNKALAHTLSANLTSEANGLGAGSRPWGIPIRGVFVGSRDWYNRPSIHR